MKFTRQTVALIAVVSLSAAACSTDLTGINKNPNSPTTAPATSLFTNATVSAMQRFNGSFQTLSMTWLWAQHIAQVQYIDEDRGHIRPTTVDNLWAGVYTAELEDFQKVIRLGTASASANTAGPAQVMQTWVYQNITDLWGDVPYSGALMGDSLGPTPPVYDAQQDIYTGMLATLTAASTAMQATGNDPGLGSADPIYKGDISKWLKFSNSLHMRLAMRMQKVDAARAATELAAAIAAPGGIMTSNDDNAMLAWPGDGVFDNPLSANFSTRDDHRISKTLLDTMNALSDPRVPIYAQPTVANPAVYTGLQNGLDNSTATQFFTTTSRPGAIFYPGATSYGTYGTSAGKKTASALMTFAEVSFIQAEAAERGMAGLGGAANYYNAGVRASILQWGGTDAQATTYLARPGVAYAGGATGLQQIGLQKWIALFGQGTEAWSEWRRTGNPSTIHMGPNAYPDVLTVPRRLIYSGNEQSVNGTNLNAAIARQGPDLYSTRMWWDKQ